MFLRELQFVVLTIILLAPVSRAEPVRLTIYDDGRACPGNCDAHVVFNDGLNGTAYAHAPGTTVPPYDKCELDSPCTVCFSMEPSQCVTVMYRGGCRQKKTFDFTPAFYQDFCARPGIPRLLEQKCGEFRLAAQELSDRTNCIRFPAEDVCADKIAQARDRQDADGERYEECMDQGEAAYNRRRTRSQQRTFACAYEKYPTGGPNSTGFTWHRLLPGACRPGTYVGRDGLDCCTGNPLIDGPFGIECSSFYPDRRLTYRGQSPPAQFQEKQTGDVFIIRPPYPFKNPSQRTN